MAVIIAFPGRKGSDTGPIEPDTKPAEDDGMDDILNRLASGHDVRDLVRAVVKKLSPASALEHRLQTLIPPNENRIAEYRTLMQRYDNEQLREIVRDASDANIQRKPQFYYAIVRAIEERQIQEEV